jgi:hypothetical protein
LGASTHYRPHVVSLTLSYFFQKPVLPRYCLGWTVKGCLILGLGPRKLHKHSPISQLQMQPCSHLCLISWLVQRSWDVAQWQSIA